MLARVLVHVRGADAGGPVVATPVQFADLACEAATVEEALGSLRAALADRLGMVKAVDRAHFAEVPAAELLRLAVAVKVGAKGSDAVEVDIGVAVVTRQVRRGPVWIAYAPAVPGLQIALRDRGALERVVAEQLAKSLRDWSPTAVLAVDEPDDAQLIVIDVTVGAATDGIGGEDDDDDDDDSILAELGFDLTASDAGRIDRREELVRQVLETLAAPGRSSVILVGPPDVGKTSLVHEVARRVALGDVPPILHGRKVWRLTANELIAGAVYTGMWQDRARRLIAEVRTSGAICFMGDPVGIIDAGTWSKSDNNVSRYLRPWVESGGITLICESTPEQLAAATKAEPSFVAAFHRVDVPEPTEDEALAIAEVAAQRLADDASVEIDADAVAAAVELTRRYEPYRSFPGKAVRLLEDTFRSRDEALDRVDRSVVTAAFAHRTGLPLALLSDTVELQVEQVQEFFESRVLGQPDATARMVDLVMVLKAGLNDPAKPLASFFFVGPTGVGKTELAKALAEFLFGSRERVLRFDMGEYPSGDAVARLIGTSWGDVEGELTRRVREQPFCVVLLDEIEKAHPSVFDALLAALGEGRLSDAAGRTADFRNAILIMTSNLGAIRSTSSSLGFASPGDNGRDTSRHYVEEAERFFRPEFFNRIDRIVVFHSLSEQTVRKIARRELDRLLLREGIARRQLLVEVDDAVVDALGSRGFHPRYGARPLQRQIERAIIEPLARLVIRRRPGPGDVVRVHLVAGDVNVGLERPAEPAAPASKRERRVDRDHAATEKAALASAAFLADVAEDDAASIVAELRGTLSFLVVTTHDRSFWERPDDARATLARIYQLEYVVDRFDALNRRAEGLVELARRVKETGDRVRVAEVWSALQEMEETLSALRLELAAAAAGPDGGPAAVRVIPVGGAWAAPWADRLLAMYGAWAERTARNASPLGGGGRGLLIDGLATYDLLVGESGLHRHVVAEGNEQLARVVVEGPDSQAPPAADAGTIVRVYEEGKRHTVRDPRTGARVTHVTSVLDEGRIDAFLLAWLKRTSAAAT